MFEDRRVQLKVKIRSLQEEAKIIREYEKKFKGKEEFKDIRYSLNLHRRCTIRKEARSSLLAYGYIRGVEYKKIEPFCRQQPDWNYVAEIAKRFLYGFDLEKFNEWRKN